MSLKGKHILIGISAGIAAYKIPFLVRLFKKAGAEVQIIMTPAAHDFVTPLTLSTLSQNPVFTEPFEKTTGKWHSHVELSLWADAFIIAPATANTMAKMVSGITDNLLMATFLSARSQVFIAPTMDLDMYQHPVTQNNIARLKEFGNIILEPNTGELASGLEGAGRMQEPDEIFISIENFFKKKTELNTISVLISAGPTYERIDPVRYIGNHSSGKMGIAIARQFAGNGANVFLISGPGIEKVIHPNIHQESVFSAEDMHKACMKTFPKCNIGIMAAAIADFTPANFESKKIKKGNKLPVIELKATEDVLFNMGKIKTNSQILIGFALETDNEVENAISKLTRKNLDLIILNSLNDKGAGFGFDTNKISIINSSKMVKDFPIKSKDEVAKDIFDECISILPI